MPVIGFFALNYWMTVVRDDIGWEEGFGSIVFLVATVTLARSSTLVQELPAVEGLAQKRFR